MLTINVAIIPTYSAVELSDVKNWINSKLTCICVWDKTREEMVIENLYYPAHFHFNHKKLTKHSKKTVISIHFEF